MLKFPIALHQGSNVSVTIVVTKKCEKFFQKCIILPTFGLYFSSCESSGPKTPRTLGTPS